MVMYMRSLTILPTLFLCLCASSSLAQVQIAPQPVVLELYTSQNCAYCPDAEDLLQALSAADASILPLTFHVDFMDDANWSDPFSTPGNTGRQQKYAALLGTRVYTPQLIIDGAKAMIGSDDVKVRRAIQAAKSQLKPVPLSLTRTSVGTATLTVPAAFADSGPATLYTIHYKPMTETRVTRGENAGSTMVSVNNVSGLARLDVWKPTVQSYTITLLSDESAAVLLQNNADGHIIGAAALPVQ